MSGSCGQSLQLEVGESIGRLPQRACAAAAVGRRLFGLLGLEVALDLELAKIADERARFAGQSLGFALQGADAIGDALA